MINLYVDDVRVCPDGWILATCVADAMSWLRDTGRVNRLSLDHDMGRCPNCCERDAALDGTALVRWMVETGNWSAQKPTVHSDNIEGRARMQGMIDRYFGSPAMGPMF